MTPAEDGACRVVTMQIAISGHWSQSIGADVSGQQGMPADISTVAIGTALAAFAGAENGANTSPAIKKIASSRPRRIEIFTVLFSHNPAAMGTSAGSLIRQNPEGMAQIVNQLIQCARRGVRRVSPQIRLTHLNGGAATLPGFRAAMIMPRRAGRVRAGRGLHT